MRTSNIWTTLFVAAVATTLCPLSLAADNKPQIVIDKDARKKDDKKKDGLDWRLGTVGTLSFADNRSVVGQVDGSTITFGFKLDLAVDYRHKAHEWRNSTSLAAQITRTPQLDSFIKAQDSLALESIYLYHVAKWWGPFARFAWSTSMFRGRDQPAAATTYSISKLDGSAESLTASSLGLTDVLRPSQLKESLGLFAQPVAKKPVSVEFRLGAGGRQTLAKGQLAIADDDGTPEVEVKELDDVLQLGTEAVLEVWGTFHNKRVRYKAAAEIMVPFVRNDLPEGDDRGFLELSNYSVKAELSFKLVQWASVDYSFKALREPQLIDELQLQNQLLLSFGLTAAESPGSNKTDGQKSSSP